MKIAIQGTDASFHAIAARTLFPGASSLLECQHFRDVFTTVKEGKADFGVVGIENSLYGSINETYDLLVQNELTISGETYEQISLHLLGTQTAQMTDITDVYSQAPALGESDVFLDTHLPNARRHEYDDTARAAQFVSSTNEPTKAAVAGEAAATQYGLKILAENIESHHDNYTRFIALSNKSAATHIEYPKSSIIFQTTDTPGSLYAVLGVFAHRSLNLTKLESRPIIGKAWRYMYYIDFEGHFSDELKKELTQYATEVRLLGTYRNGTIKKT